MTPTQDRSLSQVLLDHWAGIGENVDEQSKKYYKDKLEHGTWIVEFTKADGSAAVMECTLDQKLTPPLKTGSTPRPESPTLIHVYSLDRKGWRSFHVTTVKSFYQKPEEL